MKRYAPPVFPTPFLAALISAAFFLLPGLLPPASAQAPVLTGTLQIKRSATEASIPTLLPGQLCYAGDTKRTFIGTATGNVLFAVPLRVQVAGVLVPAQNTINFAGSGVSVADDSANNRTNVTITGGGGGYPIYLEGQPTPSGEVDVISFMAGDFNLSNLGPSGTVANKLRGQVRLADFGTAGTYTLAGGATITTDNKGRVSEILPGGDSGGGGGTVTSVGASGGTTGLTFGGSPITTSGTFTLSGTLALGSGGTGGATAAAALTNLGGVPATRTLTAGTGISPGGLGNLSANRTISLDFTAVTSGTYSYPRFLSVNPQGQITSVLQGNGLEPLGVMTYLAAGESFTYSNTNSNPLPSLIFAKNGSTVTLPNNVIGSLGTKVYISNIDAGVNPSVASVIVSTVVNNFLGTGTNLYDASPPLNRTVSLAYGDGMTLVFQGDRWVITGIFRRNDAGGGAGAGAAYSGTTNSIPFVGSGGSLTENNSSLSWTNGSLLLRATNIRPFTSYQSTDGTAGTTTTVSQFKNGLFVGGTGGITPGFSGTAGSIPFVGSGGSLTESNATLFRNASTGNIGIGTSSPSAILHVVGGGAGQGNAIIVQSTNNAGINLNNSGGGSGAKMWGVGANTLDDSLNFRVLNDAGTAIVSTPLTLYRNNNLVSQGSIKAGAGFIAGDGSAGITEDLVIGGGTGTGSVTLHIKNGLITGHTP